MPAPIRILLVEDFAPFRRFVRLVLQSPQLEIAGEAVDGLEGVQKAKELQPDVILLDLGLPKLGGIHAAERIRKVAPAAKLLFVSFENAPEIVQAAIGSGADGYVQKERIHSDLLNAIHDVLDGRQFVGCDVLPS